MKLWEVSSVFGIKEYEVKETEKLYIGGGRRFHKRDEGIIKLGVVRYSHKAFTTDEKASEKLVKLCIGHEIELRKAQISKHKREIEKLERRVGKNG